MGFPPHVTILTMLEAIRKSQDSMVDEVSGKIVAYLRKGGIFAVSLRRGFGWCLKEFVISQGIRTYIMRRQDTVAQYIVTRPILDFCERSALRLGAWVSRLWWEHDSIDLEGGKKRTAVEFDGEEEIIKDEVMPV